MLLYIIYSPVINWLFITLIILILLSVLLLPAILFSNLKERLIIKTCLAAIVVNLFLNIYFYPSLLTYQSGSQAAYFANKKYKDLPVVEINDYYSQLEFYVKQPVYTSDSSLKNMPAKPYLIYIASSDLPLLQLNDLHYVTVQKFEDFRISRLNFRFINKATRQTTLSGFQLLLIP